MNPRQIQIITIVMSALGLIGVIVLGGILYVEFSSAEPETKTEQVNLPREDVETMQSSFGGRPVSTSLEQYEGTKAITLRGKVASSGEGAYELADAIDSEVVKVVISPETTIYRLESAADPAVAPVATPVSFDAFTVGSLDEVYMVLYETTTDDVTFSKGVASLITIHPAQ